jgi:glycosyltransferase involved in cell wall biosynthesis
MLRRGSRNQGFELDVVVCVLQGCYDLRAEFRKLRDEQIAVRPFQWRFVSRRNAEEMLDLADLKSSEPLDDLEYAMPDDGHNHLLDCDCWWFVSDRVPRPVVPMRPYAVLVSDALQRYVPAAATPGVQAQERYVVRPLLQQAAWVTATTPQTVCDLQSYYGLHSERIEPLPIFTGYDFPTDGRAATPTDPYFVWLTNTGVHKNHEVVLDALEIYDAIPDAKLQALIVGPTTEAFRPDTVDDPQRPVSSEVLKFRKRIASTPALARRIEIGGELTDPQYCDALRRCRFLLSANRYDNGCLATIDAVYLRRPVLCSRYPTQQYHDEQLQLNGVFFDPHDPRDLAEKLAWMERSADEVSLPSMERLERHAWANRADEVFEIARRRLLEEAICVYR